MVRRLLVGMLVAIAAGIALLAAWLHLWLDWPWPLAVLSASVVPLALDAALLGLQFVIGAWQRRRVQPDLHYGLGADLRAWLGEIAASLRTFLYAQVRYGARAAPSGDAPGRMPVLLVHGYLCNRGIWHPFARWLAARGHAVETLNLEPVFGAIDDYVPLLAEALARLRARSGAARVAIVAHSMGGLAVRAFIARHGCEDLGAVVTLGTPHRGTWMARFGHGANARQMRLDSAWLRALAAREPSASRALFTVVLTHHDNMVLPQPIQTLEGAQTIALSALGHVALAYDHAVWEHAAHAIDAASAPRSASPSESATAA